MKRFFAGFLAGITLCSVLLLTGIPGVLPNVLTRMDQKALANWRAARLMMLRDTAFLACATQDDVRQAADLRGWDVEIEDPKTTNLPDRLKDAQWALRVHTRPPMPLGKIAGDLYGFDSRDCLMR